MQCCHGVTIRNGVRGISLIQLKTVLMNNIIIIIPFAFGIMNIK